MYKVFVTLNLLFFLYVRNNKMQRKMTLSNTERYKISLYKR